MAEAKITISAVDLASDVLERVKQALEQTGAAGGAAFKSLGGEMKGFGESITSAVEHPLDFAKASFTELLEELGPVGVGLAGMGAVVGAVGATLFELAEGAAKAGESVLTFSRLTGDAVSDVGALSAAATIGGSSLEGLEGMLMQMQRRMDATGPDAEKFNEALGHLGINADAFRAADPSDRIGILSQAMHDAAGSTTMMSDAIAIMGRGAMQNLPFLMKNFDELKAKGEELGYQWSGETVQASEHLSEAVAAMGVQFSTFKTSLGVELIPAVTATVGWFNSLTESVKQHSSFVLAALNPAIAETRSVYQWLTGALGENENAAQRAGAAQDAVNKLWADAHTQGLSAADAAYQIAEKMLDLGDSEATIQAATGLTTEEIKALALQLKMARTEADDYASTWDRVNAAFANAHPSIAGIDSATRGLVKDMQDAGVSQTDIAAATGLTVGQVKALETAFKEAEAAAKKYGHAWTELSSIGGSYAETVATLQPQQEVIIEQYLRAGASVGLLANAFPNLTEVQIKAVETMIKANDKFAQSWTKTTTISEAELTKWGFTMVSMTSDTEKAFSDMGLKMSGDLNKLADQAIKDYDLIAASGVATPREIEQAHAKMVAAVEAADTSMTGIVVSNAKAAGFQTIGAMQETTDKQKDLYDEMVASGLFTTDELSRQWKRYEDARQAESKESNAGLLHMSDQTYSAVSGSLGALASHHKAAAIAQSIIATYLAATRAFAEGGGWPWGAIAAAATVVAGFEMVHQIEAQPGGWAQGGVIPYADGGVTFRSMGSDTVPAMLTPGEGILTADTTRRLGGAPAIEQLNRGGSFDVSALTDRLDRLHADQQRQASSHENLVKLLPFMIRHAMRGA